MRKLTIKAKDLYGKTVEFRFGIAKPQYVDGFTLYEIKGERLIHHSEFSTFICARLAAIGCVSHRADITAVIDEEQ